MICLIGAIRRLQHLFLYSFTIILCFLCTSCLYLGRSEYFNDVLGRCSYLETDETLYMLFGIDKFCEPWFKSLLPIELQVGTVRQILFIIEIHKDGTVHSQGFLLKTPMGGFYTATGVYLLKIDNDVLIFDHRNSYLLRDNELFPCKNDKLLSSLMNGYYGGEESKILADWNGKYGYKYGDIMWSWSLDAQSFDWEKATITLIAKRGKRNNYGIRNFKDTTLTISCPEILKHPIHLVIPKEYSFSHFPPNFIMFPYVSTEENDTFSGYASLPEIKPLSKPIKLPVDLTTLGLGK